MQTFLPYSDFRKSAIVLDRQRLGKQRVECYQILKVLFKLSKGWANHPAVKMWVGYEQALIQYTYAVCDEWISMGYKDTIKEKVAVWESQEPTRYPDWLGLEEFHLSHQSNLLRKDKTFYSQYQWGVEDDLPYYWPTNENQIIY